MGITKFTSFVVFLFGILLLLVIAVTFVMRWLDTPAPGSKPVVRTAPPPCSLAELKLGTGAEFRQKVNELFEKGGIDAVRDFIDKEFVPGRVVVLDPTTAADPPAEMVLLDREMRRCDLEGSEQMGVVPVLARLSSAPVMAEDVRLSSWSLTTLREPFKITTWWVARAP